jgi:hypothetical protein
MLRCLGTCTIRDASVLGPDREGNAEFVTVKPFFPRSSAPSPEEKGKGFESPQNLPISIKGKEEGG